MFNLLTSPIFTLKLSKILSKSPLGKEGSDIISAKIVPSWSIVLADKNEPSGNLTEYLPPDTNSSLKELIIVLSVMTSSSTPALRKPSVIKLASLPYVVLTLPAIWAWSFAASSIPPNALFKTLSCDVSVNLWIPTVGSVTVSYTHLRAHET